MNALEKLIIATTMQNVSIQPQDIRAYVRMDILAVDMFVYQNQHHRQQPSLFHVSIKNAPILHPYLTNKVENWVLVKKIIYLSLNYRFPKNLYHHSHIKHHH